MADPAPTLKATMLERGALRALQEGDADKLARLLKRLADTHPARVAEILAALRTGGDQ